MREAAAVPETQGSWSKASERIVCDTGTTYQGGVLTHHHRVLGVGASGRRDPKASALCCAGSGVRGAGSKRLCRVPLIGGEMRRSKRPGTPGRLPGACSFVSAAANERDALLRSPAARRATKGSRVREWEIGGGGLVRCLVLAGHGGEGRRPGHGAFRSQCRSRRWAVGSRRGVVLNTSLGRCVRAWVSRQVAVTAVTPVPPWPSMLVLVRYATLRGAAMQDVFGMACSVFRMYSRGARRVGISGTDRAQCAVRQGTGTDRHRMPGWCLLLWLGPHGAEHGWKRSTAESVPRRWGGCPVLLVGVCLAMAAMAGRDQAAHLRSAGSPRC